jgi:hypothetical protein
MDELKQLIAELEAELKSLQDELAILEKFFSKKGHNGDKFRDAMLQKAETEKYIAEVELDLELTRNDLKKYETNNQQTDKNEV